ncbi:hypothetical protein ACP3V3_02180 [Vibrio sp. PNB22_3_1]
MKRYKRDRFVSASEVASVARCPYFYYLNVNGKEISDHEKASIRRGDAMHHHMAKNAKNHVPFDEQAYKRRRRSWFVRLIAWLLSILGRGRG